MLELELEVMLVRVPNESYLRYSDLVIDSQAAFVLFLILNRTALLWSWTLRARLRFKWCCDKIILLKNKLLIIFHEVRPVVPSPHCLPM